ncbi:hypothetical protein [Qingshengfaniella alkalisoli]|uniref:Uncharacterized protein n=1 Tax=Qingshengfaniella alkalisoli TaxID=2599296 RepID=A0A5B8IWT6_9RHOB|nr:hypothetical protein [Qingshengfaniella alkalisoli]QDY69311.1 hypothetical protein FPZ52_06490 [Qingshengfaniella alkalisoli]
MNIGNQKFRISAYAAEFIKMARFSPSAAKLLFALIYLQEQTDEAWPTIHPYHVNPKDHFVLVKQLREIGFPGRTRSSRFLRNPVNELACTSDLFDHLAISRNGRYLTWQFSKNFFDVMADMDVYALIDISEISMCRRKYDGALLSQIALHRKKRVPEFRLVAPNRGFECSTDMAAPELVPSRVKRQLSPSLQTWANVTGITFAVLLVQSGALPGYTDIVIRMRHETTQWPKHRFTKRAATSLFWTVAPEKDVASADLEEARPKGPPFYLDKKG